MSAWRVLRLPLLRLSLPTGASLQVLGSTRWLARAGTILSTLVRRSSSTSRSLRASLSLRFSTNPPSSSIPSNLPSSTRSSLCKPRVTPMPNTNLKASSSLRLSTNLRRSIMPSLKPSIRLRPSSSPKCSNILPPSNNLRPNTNLRPRPTLSLKPIPRFKPNPSPSLSHTNLLQPWSPPPRRNGAPLRSGRTSHHRPRPRFPFRSTRQARRRSRRTSPRGRPRSATS